jgi:tetratricopeptide (TPR) repeat protein
VAAAWFQAAADLVEQIPEPANPVLALIGPIRVVFEASVSTAGPVPAAALDAAVDSSHPWVSATARLLRGHMKLNVGRDHAAAEADFDAAWASYHSLGERWGMAFTLFSLAMLCAWRGEFAAAVRYHEQALELAAELGTMEDLVVFRAQLARELWLLGQREQARAAVAQATRDADRLGLPEGRAYARLVAGNLARLDGELGPARALLCLAAEFAGQQTVALHFRALTASELGLLAGQEGDLEDARARHAEALAAGRPARDAPLLAQVLIGLADLAIREADPAWAAELLGASLSIRGTPDRSIVDEARLTAAARAALGQAGYDAAYRRGRAVTVDTLDGLLGDLLGPATPGA